MNASGADDGHPAPAAPGGDAAAPDIAALAGLVEQLGTAPAPLGSAAREQVSAARGAIRRVMKQYDDHRSCRSRRRSDRRYLG